MLPQPASLAEPSQYAETVALLRLESVSKHYATDGARVDALRDVTLSFSPGEFVSLAGPSGCGKSTLLNLAGAMDFPSSGTVSIDGVSTTALNDAALTRLRRDKTGFIFQSFQLLQNLSVVENVELPLLLAGAPHPRERALERLEWVELSGLADRFPHQLSGGQMQRAAIARALVNDPRILLADEPTGNLDTATGAVILTLLRRIVDEHGTLLLMATHSTEAAAASDRIVRLRDGRLESPPAV